MVQHRWTRFLKETKMWSWKGWVPPAACLLRVCPNLSFCSSCLLCSPGPGKGAEATRGDRDDEITLKWSSKLHRSLTSAPVALGWLLYQRQRLIWLSCSWIYWVVRQKQASWISGRAAPGATSDFQIHRTTWAWGAIFKWVLSSFPRVWSVSLMYTWCWTCILFNCVKDFKARTVWIQFNLY